MTRLPRLTFSFVAALLGCLIRVPSAASPPEGVPPARADLQVDFLECRSDRGMIAVSLFRSQDGFPDKADKAVTFQVLPIKNKRAAAIFKDLPEGSYALTFIHDENNNGRIDTNMLGIPTEGYGASNDARGTFGPPTFDQARFEHRPPLTTLTVRTHYFPIFGS